MVFCDLLLAEICTTAVLPKTCSPVRDNVNIPHLPSSPQKDSDFRMDIHEDVPTSFETGNVKEEEEEEEERCPSDMEGIIWDMPWGTWRLSSLVPVAEKTVPRPTECECR